MAATKPLILLAGGDRDPNLHQLDRTLRDRGCDRVFLAVGEQHPWLAWDLESDQLWLNGEVVRPEAAFVRHDVFTHLADPRPATAQRSFAWYTAIAGWIAAHESVRFLNRDSMLRGTNKPHVLHLAREAGLAIPPTLVTNHLERASGFGGERAKIVKPVNGGGYCRGLAAISPRTKTREEQIAASPAIVQSALVQPEYRVYRIGTRFFGFAVISDSLDYREKQDCRLEVWRDIPAALLEGLRRLTDRLGLDFGAADFKTDAASGDLLFLEVNSGPMFAAFDLVADGALTHAMADFLEDREPDPSG